MNRSEPFSLTEVVHSNHIEEIYARRQCVSEDKASRETEQATVVLWLRIGEPQGDGILVWHRGEELPRLLYFET